MIIPEPEFKFALRDDLKDKLEFLPTKAEPYSTGFDVRCASRSSLTLRAGDRVKIPLGFRMFAPQGWYLELRPRSSTFVKKQLHALYGVIDEHFSDEVMFACQYLPEASEEVLHIEIGERIGQIIPIPRWDMKVNLISNEYYDQLCKNRETLRTPGGFGSTGDK